MTRRLTWLLALAALVALAVAPTGLAGSKKGVKLSRGTTTVTLDAALGAQGITATAKKPAKLDGSDLSFAVTNGRAVVDTSTPGTIVLKSATVKHVGRVTLAKGDAKVALQNPTAVVTDGTAGTLTAKVAGRRVDVATLVVDPSKLTVDGRKVTLTDVQVKLTPDAAGALSGLAGTPDAFKADDLLGTATLATRIVGKVVPKTKPAKSHVAKGKKHS
ncbi:MAG TPA: HtaA domain-containing protein [Solirubrobacteraceae bacterium]|nr:HtaA domain-containing protein [Solirubrobacteraceae bacterium]